MEQQHKRDAVVLSENLKKRMQEPSLSVQKPADPLPDEAEQERHAVTHLPFQSWCSVCVRSKSKEDRTLQNTDFEQEDSGVLTIQMDWSFLGKELPCTLYVGHEDQVQQRVPYDNEGSIQAGSRSSSKVLVGTWIPEGSHFCHGFRTCDFEPFGYGH